MAYGRVGARIVDFIGKQGAKQAAKQTAKKGAGSFREAAMAAVPEALQGGLVTGAISMLGNPSRPDMAGAYMGADILGSIGTLGMLNKFGIKNPIIRTIANFGTAELAARGLNAALGIKPPTHGQNGQTETVAQQQNQRGEVNGQSEQDLAGKYMEDTMFQAMQTALQPSTMMDDYMAMATQGVKYNPAQEAKYMAQIMGLE